MSVQKRVRRETCYAVRIFICSILAAIIALSLGCAAWGNPSVKNISTGDLANAPIALTQYIKENQIPTNWIGGVVVQTRWQRSYGMNNDAYNKVMMRVYVPNKLVFVIPCGPRQEAGFVEDYDPGDIIAMAWDGTARVGSPQDTVRLCKEDVIMMKKEGALNAAVAGTAP